MNPDELSARAMRMCDAKISRQLNKRTIGRLLGMNPKTVHSILTGSLTTGPLCEMLVAFLLPHEACPSSLVSPSTPGSQIDCPLEDHRSIKLAFAYCGLTAEEIASRVRCDKEAVSQYFFGKRNTSLLTMRILPLLREGLAKRLPALQREVVEAQERLRAAESAYSALGNFPMFTVLSNPQATAA